jgi:hypothetical protein
MYDISSSKLWFNVIIHWHLFWTSIRWHLFVQVLIASVDLGCSEEILLIKSDPSWTSIDFCWHFCADAGILNFDWIFLAFVLCSCWYSGLQFKFGISLSWNFLAFFVQVLIASVDLGCSEEILTILSMLSAQNIFHRCVNVCELGALGMGSHISVGMVSHHSVILKRQTSFWASRSRNGITHIGVLWYLTTDKFNPHSLNRALKWVFESPRPCW